MFEDKKLYKKVEWISVPKGEARLCKGCEELDGKIMSLNLARKKYPLHPNCRCVIIGHTEV